MAKRGRPKKVTRRGSIPASEQYLTHALRQDPLLARIMASLGQSDVSPYRSPEELLTFLQSGGVEARANAARRLGERHVTFAIPALAQRLREDKQATVRAAAAAALGDFAASAPAGPLLDALSDESEQVRASAAWALGEMGERLPEEALLPLFAALYNEEEDTYVRMSAVTALGNVGERVPVEWLTGALEDRDWQVRQAATLALGRQGNRVPFEALEAHLNDESIFVCQAVEQSLNQLMQAGLLRYAEETSKQEDVPAAGEKESPGGRGQANI